MAATPVETLQQVTKTGLTPSYSNAGADGHYIPNDGRVVLRIKNTNAATRTVTAVTPRTSANGLAIADETATVAATTGDMVMGPFTPDDFNDANGRVLIQFSATAGVTFCPMRLP